MDTHVSVVDIADTVEGHLLAAERGARRRALRAQRRDDPLGRGARDRRRPVGRRGPRAHRPAGVARAAAALAEGVARLRGRSTSLCRARVGTILHGHRYDGSRATRELGLEYTPVAETFRRTIDWAVAEGLVTRPLPRQPGRA